MTDNVCAIIVSYNEVDNCEAAINALHDQVSHIVVVDNYSTSNNSSKLKSLYENDTSVSLLLLDDNYGIGYALNRGVELSLSKNYSWILTMDQDSVASLDMVNEFFRCIESDAIKNNSSALCFFSSYSSKSKNETPCQEVYIGITSGNLVHSSVFRKYGLYNESFFIDSVDFEYFLRIKDNGIQFIKASNATMVHTIGNINYYTKGKVINRSYTHSPLRRYYIFRNHLYLCKWYFFKNPIYLTWKTVNLVGLFFNIILFETNRRKNIQMIFSGIKHFFIGVSGKYYHD